MGAGKGLRQVYWTFYARSDEDKKSGTFLCSSKDGGCAREIVTQRDWMINKGGSARNVLIDQRVHERINQPMKMEIRKKDQETNQVSTPVPCEGSFPLFNVDSGDAGSWHRYSSGFCSQEIGQESADKWLM